MMKKSLRFWVVLSYLVMIGVNWMANGLPLNGLTTGDISDAYPNLFAPIGFTFAIWGVIYGLLLGFVVYQYMILSGKKDKMRATVEKVGGWFALNALANAAWIFAWHYGVFGLSIIIILFMLVSLILIAGELRKKVWSGKEWWLIKAPFDVYFGWITVATIANVTVYLVSINWDAWGMSQEWWTVVMLVVGAVIGLMTSWWTKSLAYLSVLIWAYTGILTKHLSANYFDGEFRSVITTLGFCLASFVLTAVGFWWKKRV